MVNGFIALNGRTAYRPLVFETSINIPISSINIPIFFSVIPVKRLKKMGKIKWGNLNGERYVIRDSRARVRVIDSPLKHYILIVLLLTIIY